MSHDTLSRREFLERAKGLALAIPYLTLAGCGRGFGGRRPAEFTGMTMGTTYSIKVTGLPPGVVPDLLHAELRRILATIDARMSTYRDDSELSRLNALPSTRWVSVSADTLAVIDAALSTSARCSGAFDATVGPLVNLWGFGPLERSTRRPPDRQIAAALERVGYANLERHPSRPAVRKRRPDLYLDLSAIAKGYGIDRVSLHLESLGIGDYLVEVGGELCGRGRNSRGQPWMVAIEEPSLIQRKLRRVVQLEDAVLATSGDYRNFFVAGGRHYSHLIDPQTGVPIHHGLASVTVIGSSAMAADALATALMVLGPDAGMHLAEREQLAALFLVKDGSDFTELGSSAFDRYRVRS